MKKGDRFGNLVAIKFKRNRHRGASPCWLFLCDCGKEKEIYKSRVKTGKNSHCGCLGRNHGLKKTRAYAVWSDMKHRCYNPSYKKFHNYGGRGITVCDRWKNTFKNFYIDMGERPVGKTIDRINNNGNYEPTNCRWATIKEQNNNTRANHQIIFNGMVKNVRQWSRFLGIGESAIHYRLKRGLSICEVLQTTKGS